jgi:hypothetical protein
MSNYSATVVAIKNLRPHKNADRLIVTNIYGNDVIVGKETKIGDRGLFFPLESQIGLEFAQANDLIRRKDINGKPTGGMFDDNRRVRAQTLRGEKSMGFWIPIESIDVLQHVVPFSISSSDFKEGQEIESLPEGVIISQKYIPRTNKTNGVNGAKKGKQPSRESKILPGQFAFHFETPQLGKNIHKLKPEDLIAITWKLHGTSAIASCSLVKRRLSLLERLIVLLGVNVEKTRREMIYASRRVIKNEFLETKQHFYAYDLWSEVGKENFEGKLHAGETIYYEIVGYLNDGGFIQKGFDYGCDPRVEMTKNWPGEVNRPTNKAYIYRITQTATDGSVIELQWNQVEERSKELGVTTVPIIYYGFAGLLFDDIDPAEHWNENFLQKLKELFVYDQDSQFCVNPVPEEGIALRIEGLKIEVFKLKSFRFLQHETKELDKGETNVEDSQVTAEDEYLSEAG